MAVFALSTGQTAIGALMIIMLGGLTGFLVFNRHPATVFLGDSGSMFLGFFLAVCSLLCANGTQMLAGLSLTLMALGVPVLDTFFAVVRRLLDRRSLFAPDRRHIHHRLIDSGVSHRGAVLRLHAISLALAATGLLMLSVDARWAPAVVTAALAVLLFVFHRIGAIRVREAYATFRRSRRLARDARECKRRFEDLQLKLRDADSLIQWWQTLRRAARYLGFSQMTIELRGGGKPNRSLLWRSPVPDLSQRVMRLNLPVRRIAPGKPVRASIDIPVDGSLESAGSRVALFGRLLDERSLTDLPESSWSAMVRQDIEDASAAQLDLGAWIPSQRDEPSPARRRL